MKLHKRYEDAGINVLPIDFSIFDGSEFEEIINKGDQKTLLTNYNDYVSKLNFAFGSCKPDIIIDDNELFSMLMAEKNRVPRISIYRTGFFRSIDHELRNPAHIHSMEKTSSGMGFDASMILRPNKKISQLQIKYLKSTHLSSDVDYFINYLNPKTKLIPGIPSIEKLPDNMRKKESFFYTGPLLVEDNPSEKLVAEIGEFFKLNKNRKYVFITTGLVDQDDIQEIIMHLLKNGYAVISTRQLINSAAYKAQFFCNAFLPLNFVCANVDLIIHQCGSGMYHYPLVHKKPVITIGTQCYDREDVALRLQQLKLSRHVPSVNDDENYMEIFTEHLEAFENGNLIDCNQSKKIQDEIYRTMLDFDMDQVIDYTLSTAAISGD